MWQARLIGQQSLALENDIFPRVDPLSQVKYLHYAAKVTLGKICDISKQNLEQDSQSYLIGLKPVFCTKNWEPLAYAKDNFMLATAKMKRGHKVRLTIGKFRKMEF